MPRRRPIWLTYRTDSALFDFVEQRLVAHAQLFGCTPAVPTDLLERLFDHRALGLDGRGFRGVGQARSAARRRRFFGGRFVVVQVELLRLDRNRPGCDAGDRARSGGREGRRLAAPCVRFRG